MPIIKSAIKRAKQAIKKRERNVGTKRTIKSAEKAFMAKPSATTLSAVQSAIDTAVKKNILEKNTAARRKSNLSKIAKEAGVKLTTGKKTVTKAPVAKKPAVKKSAAKPVAAKKPATKKPATKKAPTK